MNDDSNEKDIIMIDSSSEENDEKNESSENDSYESAEEEICSSSSDNEPANNNNNINNNNNNNNNSNNKKNTRLNISSLSSSSSSSSSSVIDETEYIEIIEFENEKSTNKTVFNKDTPELTRQKNFSENSFKKTSPFHIINDSTKSSKSPTTSNFKNNTRIRLLSTSSSSSSSKSNFKKNDQNNKTSKSKDIDLDQEIVVIDSDNSENNIVTNKSESSSDSEDSNDEQTNNSNIDKSTLNLEESDLSICSIKTPFNIDEDDDNSSDMAKDMALTYNRVENALRTLVIPKNIPANIETTKSDFNNDSSNDTFSNFVKNTESVAIERSRRPTILNTDDSSSNHTINLSDNASNKSADNKTKSRLSNSKGLIGFKKQVILEHNQQQKQTILPHASNQIMPINQKTILEQNLKRLNINDIYLEKLKPKIILNNVLGSNFYKSQIKNNNFNITYKIKSTTPSSQKSSYYGDLELNEETRTGFVEQSTSNLLFSSSASSSNTNISSEKSNSNYEVTSNSKLTKQTITKPKAHIENSDSSVSADTTSNENSKQGFQTLNKKNFQNEDSNQSISSSKSTPKRILEDSSKKSKRDRMEISNSMNTIFNVTKGSKTSENLNSDAKKNINKAKSNENIAQKRHQSLESSDKNNEKKKLKKSDESIQQPTQILSTSEKSSKSKDNKNVKNSTTNIDRNNKTKTKINNLVQTTKSVSTNNSNKTKEHSTLIDNNNNKSKASVVEKDTFAESFEKNNSKSTSSISVKKTVNTDSKTISKDLRNEKQSASTLIVNNSVKSGISNFKIPLKKSELSTAKKSEINKNGKNITAKTPAKNDTNIEKNHHNEEQKSASNNEPSLIGTTDLTDFYYSCKNLTENRSISNTRDDKKRKTNNSNRKITLEASTFKKSKGKPLKLTKPIGKVARSSSILQEKQTVVKNSNNNNNNNNENINNQTINKNLTTTIMVRELSCKQPITLRQLIELEKNFTPNISHPYMNAMYLMSEYIKKMSGLACLDFNLLKAHLPNDAHDELSVHHLTDDQKLSLCKLMSRSAGRINYFKVFGLGCDLRGKPHTPSYAMSTYVDSSVPLETAEQRLKFFIDNIGNLTISEAYSLYKMYLNRKRSPFRKFELYWMIEYQNIGIQVHFENDGNIVSNDASLDSVVKYILHEEPYNKGFTANTFNTLHRNKYFSSKKQTDESEQESDNMNKLKKIFNNENVFNSYYYKNLMRAISKNLKNLSVQEKINNAKINQSVSYIDDNQVTELPITDEPRFSAIINKPEIEKSERGYMMRAKKFVVLNDKEYISQIRELNKSVPELGSINLEAAFDEHSNK